MGFWDIFGRFPHRFPRFEGLEESELFTDFTESAFYSPDGLEATAPVFDKAPELPSPLGQVLVPRSMACGACREEQRFARQ